MCGIVAVLRAEPTRAVPDALALAARVEDALRLVVSLAQQPPADEAAALRLAADLRELAADLRGTDAELRGVPGLTALLRSPAAVALLEAHGEAATTTLAALEEALDRTVLMGEVVEVVNSALVELKDALWAIHKDRLRMARAVGALTGPAAEPAAIAAFMSIQVALASLDRLEVRGRDSAGLHVLVHDHDLDLSAPSVRALLGRRAEDALFGSGSVRVVDGCLSFVYKAAAEIGELGDNTRVLRAAIAGDELLKIALASPRARATVLAHTRWASVGLIGQPNAHPLNSEELDELAGLGAQRPYVVGALNGDVDNHADLKAIERLQIPPEITTDAKVIPTLMARRLAEGAPPVEAFRRTVASFEGSVAIACETASAPGTLFLAQRGSGQALYVGLAEDAYVVASEPYGLVEETSTYLRLDGETPADPANPEGSRGQIVVLDATRAGTLDGILRLTYAGEELPVGAGDLQVAEITTRDIDRGPHRHFLLKEMAEAPASWRKTLRGRIVPGWEGEASLRANLSTRELPPDVRDRLASGRLNRIVVIGQGTAAVAGQALAALLRMLTPDAGLTVDALGAAELSGFGMRADMSDTLVVAISQSGTTTDTNRTVDLARVRGASVIAIVNRRNSDLTEKADGVVYTSDGRDVEMAVPSTKAFYAQIAAGALLACAVAETVGARDTGARARVLAGLRDLPAAMERVLERREAIAAIAQAHATPRRYWAVVGNGLNRVAAEEVRIKASELCYKSIACDATEDKKHIDLSSEPLILVCAAGLSGSNADDVAKEIAIYRAHKAAPIVIATEGDARFDAALAVIDVPAVLPELAFVLSAMAGHLFSYEAALAIDAQALPLRAARSLIEARATRDGDRVLERLREDLRGPATQFFDALRTGAYDGHLEASSAVRLASLFRFAIGAVPLDAYELEHGRVGSPQAVVDDLAAALTRAIDELTRPIDTIKHQAKTVTVGISRTDEALLAVPLVRAVLDAGAGRDQLAYRVLRVLAALDPAVAEVTGFTRYRIEGDVEGQALVTVVDRGGISRDIPSRTEAHPVLRGTKRRVSRARQVLAARGRADGRTVVLVPEVKGDQTTGLTLLHVRFVERLSPPVARSVLEGYGRYAPLVDAVTETEPAFRDDLLAEIPVVDLLTEPVQALAERWRT